MSTEKVAVVDSVAAFRRGLVSALTEAGIAAYEYGDLVEWADGEDEAPAVVSVRERAALHSMAAAITARELVVVAVLRDAGVRQIREALSAGAATAVAESSSLESIMDTVRMALRGASLLPTHIVRGLIAGKGLVPDGYGVSLREARWIRTLASGATVSQLARDAGYSEREMYRFLHQMYHRMGVKGRAEALVTATRWGLVD